jgi:hypothetical protein
MDHAATNTYYAVANAASGPGQPAAMPPSAARLLEALRKYTTPPAAAALPPASARTADGDPDPRRRLAEASLRLYAVIDPSWKAYLAMPPEIYTADRSPSAEAIGRTLARFDAVGQDPRYRLLVQTVEFRATYDGLRRFLTTAAHAGPTLSLPPPPQ